MGSASPELPPSPVLESVLARREGCGRHNHGPDCKCKPPKGEKRDEVIPIEAVPDPTLRPSQRAELRRILLTDPQLNYPKISESRRTRSPGKPSESPLPEERKGRGKRGRPNSKAAVEKAVVVAVAPRGEHRGGRFVCKCSKEFPTVQALGGHSRTCPAAQAPRKGKKPRGKTGKEAAAVGTGSAFEGSEQQFDAEGATKQPRGSRSRRQSLSSGPEDPALAPPAAATRRPSAIQIPADLDLNGCEIVGSKSSKNNSAQRRKIDPEQPMAIVRFHATQGDAEDAEESGEGESEESAGAAGDGKEGAAHFVEVPTISTLPGGYPGLPMPFYQPHHYIKHRPGSHITLETDVSPYTYDSDDEPFVAQIGQLGVDEDDFEATMAAFERVAYDLQQQGCPRPEFAFSSLEGEAMQGQPHEPSCVVCSYGQADPKDLAPTLLQCDICGIQIHRSCYGPDTPNDAKPKPPSCKGSPGKPVEAWRCDLCVAGRDEESTRCALCPSQASGALRRTSDSRWCHTICGLGVPELCLRSQKSRQVVFGISAVPWHTWKTDCDLCGLTTGLCVPCSHRGCQRSVHMGCAREAGLHVSVHSGYRASVFCQQHTPWPGRCVDPDLYRMQELPPDFRWPKFPPRIATYDPEAFDGIVERVVPQAELLQLEGAADAAEWQAKMLLRLRDRHNVTTRKATLVYPHWLARRQAHPRGTLLREYDRDLRDEVLTRKRRR